MDTSNAMVHVWPWLFGNQTKSDLINIGKGLDWRRRLIRTGRGLETVGRENSWNILLTRMKLVEKINHQAFLKYTKAKR